MNMIPCVSVRVCPRKNVCVYVGHVTRGPRHDGRNEEKENQNRVWVSGQEWDRDREDIECTHLSRVCVSAAEYVKFVGMAHTNIEITIPCFDIVLKDVKQRTHTHWQ